MEREQLGEASPALSSPQSSSPQQQQQQPAPQVQQRPVVRPRHAPTYSVVNAIIEKEEDGPGPRCGHTLTAVGEEGTPGYVGPRLILFGGATALEGNSSASGTPSSAGSAGIPQFGNAELELQKILRTLFDADLRTLNANIRICIFWRLLEVLNQQCLEMTC